MVTRLRKRPGPQPCGPQGRKKILHAIRTRLRTVCGKTVALWMVRTVPTTRARSVREPQHLAELGRGDAKHKRLASGERLEPHAVIEVQSRRVPRIDRTGEAARGREATALERGDAMTQEG
jgi:hypothetical protein